MLVYPYSWHSGTNYIGTWRGKDTNNNNEVFSGCELRVTGATGASNIGNRQCDLTLANQNITLPANQWVRLTITCDGTKRARILRLLIVYILTVRKLLLQNLLNVGDHPLLKDSRWDIR